MKAEIALPKVMSNITMEVVVTGIKRTRFRLWFGRIVMILAALIMGCNIEIGIEE